MREVWRKVSNHENRGGINEGERLWKIEDEWKIGDGGNFTGKKETEERKEKRGEKEMNFISEDIHRRYKKNVPMFHQAIIRSATLNSSWCG